MDRAGNSRAGVSRRGRPPANHRLKRRPAGPGAGVDAVDDEGTPGCRLAESTYLWVDDNLSNDYFWRYLTDADIELVATWPMFGRVGCFKGYDADSFAFNTAAAPELFGRQFELFRRHLELGVDCYGYVTLTGPDPTTVGGCDAPLRRPPAGRA